MKYLSKTLLAAGVAAALPSSALAAGFGVAEQSTSALGSAFAGAGALSENPSNQWYNPATLSRLEGTQASLSASQVMIDTTFKSDVGNPSGDFEDVNSAVPSLYFSSALNDRTTFGLGVNAPFGTKLEYEDNWGGDNYATESDLQSLNVNPSFSFDVTSSVQFGIGLNYQKIEADLDNDVSRLEGKDKALGWNTGVLFEPADGQRFGLSYRSKIDYEVNGDITFKLPAPAGDQKRPAETNITVPETWNLSYAGDVGEQSQVLFSAQHREWSRLDSLIVNWGPDNLPSPLAPSNPPNSPVTEDFDWDNSQRYSLGFRHTLNGGTVLRAGYAHETSTQESAENRSARVPDNDRDWFTLGGTFNPVERMSIDLGYAHVMVDDADIDHTDRGPLQGTYELTANIVSAQLNYKF